VAELHIYIYIYISFILYRLFKIVIGGTEEYYRKRYKNHGTAKEYGATVIRLEECFIRPGYISLKRW
jgi:hypothetical protein